MSWMDSWSRPGKRPAVLPPFYLTQEHAAYCQTCGRAMSSRKIQQAQTKIIKYCSDGCRHHKPGPLDRKIERAMVALLNAEPGSGIEETAAKSKFVKGDQRNIITMQEVENLMFRPKPAPPSDSPASRPTAETSDASDIDAQAEHGAPPSEGSVGGLASREGSLEPATSDGSESIDEGSLPGAARPTAEDELKKRQEGHRRAEQREMVRRAARRLVVFGCDQERHNTHGDHPKKPNKRAAKGTTAGVQGSASETVRRKCEALMNGTVVEPSFAKGNWAIRWREEI
ncbi:hypothetical protein PV08_03577 [Exophiala spinifera]|uniref:Uncharacterized protein n=1 Tax=Exophiala spinifera TaxID=91928 RepID=A0A0D2BK34_9EURO|nr:uncharacterized protein PV08_03577 [Exophiala spinifera]KIW19283.1 hypothetical protein PV08_03577 [Exophiala spinifera]